MRESFQDVLNQLIELFPEYREKPAVAAFIALRLHRAGLRDVPEFFSVVDVFRTLLGYESPAHAVRRAIPENIRAKIPRISGNRISVIPREVAMEILEFAFENGRFKSQPVES